ncbi:MAG: outer membrane protein OmpA-like peptidoglycan-associated protein [Polaribacter sp.]|jgi:outer membrane protein OmpA-like peptidoglycan-associated protein
MKHLTLIILFCSLWSQPLAFGQMQQDNLNTLIVASETLTSDVSDQVNIKNLININSDGIEYSPVFYRSGLVFSTDRSTKKTWLGRLLSNNNSNLFFTGIDKNGDIQNAIPLPGKINSKRHEGSATFNANGDLMIYTRNRKMPSANGQYELKLSSAVFQEGKWIEQADLPFNKNYRSCHPALSSDGNMLVFSSNRPNGLGGMDLYASEFVDGQWSIPYNLGQEVNSFGDEVFPFIDAEGTLYFSSNGHPGMGGLDIYKASQNSTCGYDNLIRFPEPYNSRWDDFSFITDQDLSNGYLTSNRPGGLGQDDIYAWKINSPIELPIETETELMTQFSILDENTGLALNETELILIQINPNILQTGFLDEPITIVNQLDKDVLTLLGNLIKPLQNPEPFTSYSISPKESYLIIAKKAGNKPYQQIVSAAQLTASESYALVVPSEISKDVAAEETIEDVGPISLMTTEESNEKEAVVGAVVLLGMEERLIAASNPASEPVVFEAQPTEEVFTSRSIPEHLLIEVPNPIEAVEIPVENTVIAFSPIYHEFNKSGVISKEEILIENIVLEMKNHSDFQLTIMSYTDSRGSKDYNLSLSQKRSETVMKKLIAQGISPLRLIAKGMGESSQINDCDENQPCTEENYKLSRRTEFRIKRLK